jgi:hypothetical protein
MNRNRPPIQRPFVGLELGPAQEFTALAIVEKTEVDPDTYDPTPARYAVRYLERFPIGTSYLEIFQRVEQFFIDPALKKGTLVVDQTGVGQPILDRLTESKLADRMVPLTITASLQADQDGRDGWRVPKKDLVGQLQIVLQSRHLQIAESLPLASLLVKELENFRTPIGLKSSEDPLVQWREGLNEDLVLAVAIGVWYGERDRFTKSMSPMVLGNGSGNPWG